MGKDDYFTLACKILVYFYKRLKGKAETPPDDYILPLTKDFPIEQDYLNYIIRHLVSDAYLEDVTITKAWGGDIISIQLEDAAITPKGIAYLQENSKMRKIMHCLPEAKAIMSLIEDLPL